MRRGAPQSVSQRFKFEWHGRIDRWNHTGCGRARRPVVPLLRWVLVATPHFEGALCCDLAGWPPFGFTARPAFRHQLPDAPPPPELPPPPEKPPPPPLDEKPDEPLELLTMKPPMFAWPVVLSCVAAF